MNKENKLPALSIDRKGFDTCWMAMSGIANNIFSIIRENKKVRIVIEYDPDCNRVYLLKNNHDENSKEKAKLYIDIAGKYLKKYGKDNAHERIKDSIDILHEFYKDGNDIGNSIGILGRIDGIILQEKA